VSGDQKVVMLVAVFNTVGNYLAFSFTGPYTVDWGDGTAPVDYASGVTAQRSFAWGDYSASTVTSEGFRQAIVTITPQAGQNLNTVNLNLRHSTPTVAYSTGVLDVRVGAPYISGFSLNTSNVGFRMLRQFEWVGACSISDFASMFSGCTSLTSIPALNTAAGTSFASMFNNCYSLTSIPALNTAAGTSFANMFSGCTSLTSIPALNTAAGTSFANMFYNCYSLTSIPALNTAAGTSFTSMFYSCTSLTSIPALNTAAGKSFTSMFSGCTSLTSIPALNTAVGTSFTSMFSGCTSLTSVELTGCKYSVSVASCLLSGTALDTLYTSLGTAAASQSITVTGNYGTPTDTPSIATAKGWTVVGS
jgi:hypothetical protein